MKNYDPDIEFGTHTVKITLQQRGYTGHLIVKSYGNCKGRDVLDLYSDFECGFDISEDDCDMKYHEDGDWYRVVLHNKDGDRFNFFGTPKEMNQLVVGMEIIDFTPGR